jgi:hypothetical protein
MEIRGGATREESVKVSLDGVIGRKKITYDRMISCRRVF